MAQDGEGSVLNRSSGFLSLQDVLYSFNNSINEEQAWSVCYQCASYFLDNQSQEKYKDIYYYGTVAIRIHKDGDVLIDSSVPPGSGKGPPRKRSSFSLSREFKTTVTQIDAIQALGSAIYKALDFGLSESEEPHLSSDLEEVIEFMTHPGDDDEGIDVERDSDDSQGKDQCMWRDIIDYCVRHLSSGQEAGHHYKAVCRALVTEAKELVTFLDNIASGQERLAKDGISNTDSLDDLQRSDWARLWVQIMRELRRGVRLKKVEQVHLPPLEYELTPFEILLEDIRTHRYKLNRIMVNGDIPPKVKSDAHAVILDFIRSRPPLKPVKQRVLSDPPRKELDSREKLMLDIKRPHSLKPVKDGKLLVKSPVTGLGSSEDDDSPVRVRKVIKPVAAFEVNSTSGQVSDSDDSYLSDDSVDDSKKSVHAPVLSPLSPVSPVIESGKWKRAVARDMVTHHATHPERGLVRRHTISECQIKKQVSNISQDIPVYEEEEEARGQRGTFVRGHASRKPTKFVSYRNKHGHRVVHGEQVVPSSSSTVTVKHVGERVNVSRSRSDHDSVRSVSSSCLHEARSRNSHVSQPQRSISPCTNTIQRASSPTCRHSARSESPVKHLSRSETFSTSTPRTYSQQCARSDVFIARSDSPSRGMVRSDTFPAPRCSSPKGRSGSPNRHVSHKVLYSVHDSKQHGYSESTRHRQTSERCESLRNVTSHSKSPQNCHVLQSEHNSRHSEARYKRLSLQVQSSEQDHHDDVSANITDSTPSHRPRRPVVRTRSHHDIRPSSLAVAQSSEQIDYSVDKDAESSNKQTKPEVVRHVSRLPRSVSSRARPKSAVVESYPRPEFSVPESTGSSESTESKPKREVKLTRQSAIRTVRPEIRTVTKSGSVDQDTVLSSTGERSTRIVRHRVTSQRSETDPAKQEVTSQMSTATKEVTSQQTSTTYQGDGTNSSHKVLTRPHRLVINKDDQDTAEPESGKKPESRPVRPILRSRSEVRPRPELRPVKGEHSPEFTLTKPDRKTVLSGPVKVNLETSSDSVDKSPLGPQSPTENKDEGGWSLGSAIKQGLSQLNVSELLHVSWKTECTKGTNSSSPCTDCRPVPRKWQNPIECLSLTLEEVTHIRMVLTKAELESLISDQDLYTNVGKGKVCFTCKKTKFSLFGQWSTKCKFCQRSVCNYCLRKVNVPTEHFEKIPVYTLSPVPISPEVLEALKVYESTGSVPHSPIQERKDGKVPVKEEDPPCPAKEEEEKISPKRRTLQRSHTIGVGPRPPPNKALLKGPQMSICCDCKTMIMEIIRASRTSVALINKGGDTPQGERETEKPVETPQRPRSMLAQFNFKSFNFPKSSSET